MFYLPRARLHLSEKKFDIGGLIKRSRHLRISLIFSASTNNTCARECKQNIVSTRSFSLSLSLYECIIHQQKTIKCLYGELAARATWRKESVDSVFLCIFFFFFSYSLKLQALTKRRTFFFLLLLTFGFTLMKRGLTNIMIVLLSCRVSLLSLWTC